MIFDVARSTIQGNAKASVRGTSDEEIPRFPFYLIPCLWVTNEFEKIMNTIKKVTLFCASIVLCFGFCGCSSDDDENTNSSSNEKKLVKVISTIEGGEVTTIFDYDNQGRLLTVKESGGLSNENYSYVWSDNNESVKVLDNRGEDFELRIVDGLVRSGFWHSLKQTLIFTYDNSRLSSYDCGYGYSGDISWDNNSISQSNNSEFIYSGKTCKGYNPYIVDYVDGNPFYNLAIAQPKLFGLHVNQLPEKIKGNDEVSLSYKLDKEGYLVKVTATYHNAYEDDETEIYEYTWK